MPRKLYTYELHNALQKNSMGETVMLNTSDSGDALDVLATAFMQEHLSCWIAELDDNDPDWSEKRYHLN